MPLSLNGSGGITYPDGSVNTTRSVSTAGDTMTGLLTLPSLNVTTGNVGFGKTNPSQKLDVVGNIQISDASGLQWSSGSVYIIGDSSNNLKFNTSSTERMRIDSSGNLLVGTTSTAPNGGFAVSPTYGGAGVCQVNIGHSSSATSGQGFIQFFYNGGGIGGITQNGTTAIAYNTSSDYRLKENIQPMQNALDVVAQLNPVTYTWKADGSDGQGFIAHELQAVVPDCVTGEKDAVDKDGKPVYQGVDTSFLVATLTAAIQELKAELDSVKAELSTLKGN